MGACASGSKSEKDDGEFNLEDKQKASAAKAGAPCAPSGSGHWRQSVPCLEAQQRQLEELAAAGKNKVLVPREKQEEVDLVQHIYDVVKDCQPEDHGMAESVLLRDVESLAGSRGQVHDIILHGPPRPPNEESRHGTICTMGMEKAEDHPELSLFCHVITRLYGMKYSCLALFAESRVWVAGSVGIPKGHVMWRISACPWDLLVPNPTTMVCEDLREDARFEHQPWTKAGWITYVSSPLVASNGHRVGAICCLDDQKHRVDTGHCRLLNNIAEIAVREVERFARVAKKIEEDDAARDAFQKSGQPIQRNMMSAHDSCIILLDTSVPGWEVLYTNISWQEWTGALREECVGKTLGDMLENAVDNSPLRCRDHTETLLTGQRFVIPKLQYKSTASDGKPMGTLFDLSFRAASVEAMDNDTLPVDIPSFVNMASSMMHIYVARMHPVNLSVPTSALSAVGKVNPAQVSPFVVAPMLIFGLRLHHVIGRGGYGTVYTATWQDNHVAAKVQDYQLTNTEELQEAELEISLGQKLVHRNVVTTFAHAAVELESKLRHQTTVDFFIDDLDDVPADWSSNSTGGFSMLCSMENSRHDSCNTIKKDLSNSLDNVGVEHLAVVGKLGANGTIMPLGGAKTNVSTTSSEQQSVVTNTARALVYPQEIRAIQVLEYCDKGCLQDAIDRGWLRTRTSQLAPPAILAVVATALDIAVGLTYLHGYSVVHGDLTAFNVLLKTFGKTDVVKEHIAGVPSYHFIKDAYGREFRAKIADFGKSRVLGVQDYMRTSSYGTITHMAPEVLKSNTLGRPADIYAFGVLLWAMWTGGRPWAGLSHTQILATVVEGTYKLTYPDGTPEDIKSLGTRCLAYEAADRPSIADVVAELMTMLTSRGAPVNQDGAALPTLAILPSSTVSSM